MFKYMKQKCYDKKKIMHNIFFTTLSKLLFELRCLSVFQSECLSVFPFLEALLAILAASEYNKYPES